MKLVLKRDMLEFLKNEIEDVAPLIGEIKKISSGTYEVDIKDIQEVKLLINDEIVYRGLDNRDTVNDIGKKMYELYDEILTQQREVS